MPFGQRRGDVPAVPHGNHLGGGGQGGTRPPHPLLPAGQRLRGAGVRQHRPGGGLRDEDRRKAHPRAAGGGAHGEGRQGFLHRDRAHQHQPSPAPPALALPALHRVSRGQQEPHQCGRGVARGRDAAGAGFGAHPAAQRPHRGELRDPGGGGGGRHRLSVHGLSPASIHRAHRPLRPGDFGRPSGAAGGRPAGGLPHARGAVGLPHLPRGRGHRFRLRFPHPGTSVRRAAFKPSPAGALCRPGRLPPGDDPHQAAPGHHREQAAGALPHPLRGAGAAHRL